MKKLLALLFSLFLFSSPSVFADDISDFQIEGISIGDSLLDYMTEGEILEAIETDKDEHSYLKEPNKYSEVFLKKDFLTYNNLSAYIKKNPTSQYVTNKNSNEKYTILGIRGMITYIDDFDNCILKRDEIAGELSNIFQNAELFEIIAKHPIDPSGESIKDGVYFNFKSGGVCEASCLDIEETFRIKNNWSEHLQVAIYSPEVKIWLQGAK